MKIKKVKVTKLFDVFDHEINFNTEAGITIIIGENGLGKTVILEMIKSFFNREFHYFKNILFKDLYIQFLDNEEWVVSKNQSKDSDFELLLKIKKKGKITQKPKVFFSFSEFDSDTHSLAMEIYRRVNFLRRSSPRKFTDRRTNQHYSSADLVRTFPEYLPAKLQPYNIPKKIEPKYNSINVSLIKTQRLLTISKTEEIAYSKTVIKYSKEISQKIKYYLALSTDISSKLDRTFPNRVIKKLKTTLKAKDKKIHSDLKELEKKRLLLDSVGLIDIEKEENLLNFDKDDPKIQGVLSVYIEDSKEKLKIFDEIASRIELFQTIINKRFKHKKLRIEKERGFTFISTILKNKEIPINNLSSGEQNELVLFYELLFKVESSSFILIDEPEISLHISWQKSFIQDLRQIIQLNPMDILIATHSPDIIGNNWELTTKLIGIEKN